VRHTLVKGRASPDDPDLTRFSSGGVNQMVDRAGWGSE